MTTIGFIGAGNMGEALIRGLVGGKVVRAADLWVSELDAARRARLVKGYRVRAAADNADLARRCGVIVLAVKPQLVGAVLAGIAPAAGRAKLVVSVAAGVTLDAIEGALKARVVRTMPNTPALVGEAPLRSRGAAASLPPTRSLSAGSSARWAPRSKSPRAHGRGHRPLWQRAGLRLHGDPGPRRRRRSGRAARGIALQLAAQTVLGAAQMVLATGAHPHQLRDQVASPGGTTIRGIAELEERGVPVRSWRRCGRRRRALGSCRGFRGDCPWSARASRPSRRRPHRRAPAPPRLARRRWRRARGCAGAARLRPAGRGRGERSRARAARGGPRVSRRAFPCTAARNRGARSSASGDSTRPRRWPGSAVPEKPLDRRAARPYT